MKRVIATFLLIATSAIAATIHFDTGWTDHDTFGLGVGPVGLTVDGKKVVAFDYTFNYFSAPGDTWEATLTQLPALPPYFSGEPFAGLRDAAVTWIAQDFTNATTHAQRVAFQYAIYALFALNSPFNADSTAEVASAMARAAHGPASNWVFINSPLDAKELKQGFVYQNTPEPSAFYLLGGGLLGMGWLLRRYKK